MKRGKALSWVRCWIQVGLVRSIESADRCFEVRRTSVMLSSDMSDIVSSNPAAGRMSPDLMLLLLVLSLGN